MLNVLAVEQTRNALIRRNGCFYVCILNNFIDGHSKRIGRLWIPPAKWLIAVAQEQNKKTYETSSVGENCTVALLLVCSLSPLVCATWFSWCVVFYAFDFALLGLCVFFFADEDKLGENICMYTQKKTDCYRFFLLSSN